MRIGVIYRELETAFISAADYDEAIKDLMEAKTQLSPDGDCCHVCGDGGHQAWECHHNPLAMARRAAREQETFRCFHCGEAFTDIESAEEHFGRRDDGSPAKCLGRSS